MKHRIFRSGLGGAIATVVVCAWAVHPAVAGGPTPKNAAGREETTPGAAYRWATDLGITSAALIVAALIRHGIADAGDRELKPLPKHIKSKLSGYFPADVIESVRWTSGYGAESLQNLAFEFGGAGAITLDTIIVFKERKSVNKINLVAHELGHVLQYRAWGIDGFAQRYVRDYSKVEAGAERILKDWRAGRKLRLPGGE